jgi:hypothetical protein
MSDLVAVANELRTLRRRLDRLEAQEHGHDQYLLTSGGRAGAQGQAQEFGYPLIAPWYDGVLRHTVDSSYFNQNAAGGPADWTAVNAASSSSLNTAIGFWRLVGSSSVTAWKYRRRLAALTEASNYSLCFGPVLWRDGRYTADATYTLGIYRDNGSGTIDETQYNRIELRWDSAGLAWQVRNVMSNGSTTYTSSYATLSVPLVQPLFFRVHGQTNGDLKRAYMGTAQLADTHTLLQEKTLAISYNTPWLQVTMARGAGVNDYLYLGGFDRTADV